MNRRDRTVLAFWWQKGIDFIRLFDSTPITLSDQKSFSFAMSNFSYMVQLQLSSFTSPVCSSSQCSLKIYVVVKEADLVRQEIFPLWALWYIKVLSVWHLLLYFMISPHMPLLYLCYHYHPSWMVLNCKIRSEGRARCCHTSLPSTKWQKKSQQDYF